MQTLEYFTSFGLPLTIEFCISDADPDTGHSYPGIENWYVTYIGNRKVKNKENIDWLYTKLKGTGDDGYIEEACSDYQ